MDITNEQTKLSDSSPKSSQHHVSYSSVDHVIPEMVITSAEDTSESERNVSECTVVLIPPSNGHSTQTNIRDTSAEFTTANSASEEKYNVDFEDITGVVKDVISKCTETVSCSVHQRPLRMEIDKNAQEQEIVKNTSMKCSPPPPPPPPLPLPPPPSSSITSPSFNIASSSESSTVTVSPTAMQRPLVFEDIVSQTEPVLEAQVGISMEYTDQVKEDVVSDKSNLGIQFAPETPIQKSSEESSSPTKKEGLHGVKKFFDSILHHDTQQPTVCSEDLELAKESVTPETPKSEKNTIKKFFQSPKTVASKTEDLPFVESQNETVESTSVSKQTKKSFFDAFKHNTVDSKESSKKKIDTCLPKEYIDDEKNLLSTESTKTSSSFVKDTKQNIKTFFDTFKHEPSEQTHPENSVPSTNIYSKSEIDVHSYLPESPKESISFAKDNKQNKKTFFSSSKHKPIDQTSKTAATEKSLSQPNIKIEDEQTVQSCALENPKETSFVKDTKQNIKLFFDTFKHDSSEIKQKNVSCKKSTSHPDFTKEPTDINVDLIESPEKIKHKESFAKNAKQNVKTFFDSFKHDQTATKIEETHKIDDIETLTKDSKQIDEFSEKHKEPISPKKDTKQSIKTFFDSFKMGDLNISQTNETSVKTISEPNLHKQPAIEVITTPDNSKQNVKSFFDNFKLGDLNAHSKNKESSSKKNISSECEFNEEPTSETTISPPKGSKHSIKNFFSFKQTKEIDDADTSVCLDSHLPEKSERDKSTKIIKSVKLDLNPKYSNGAENVSASVTQMNGHEGDIICEIRERAQSVPVEPSKSKNVFSLEKKPEICASILDSPEKITGEHKGSHQSMKKFFESFKPEKIDPEKSSLQIVFKKKENMKEKNVSELLAENEELKTVEKLPKEKKSKSIRRSLSDKISREEVVQNFKGFFDSLSHKSSSKKSVKDSEHIYDVVEVKPEMDKSIPVVSISSEVSSSVSNMVKSETQEIQKSPELLKNVPSSGVEDLSVTINESGSPKSDKNMFNALGENILALTGKMLHPKEKRKSGLVEESLEKSDKISKKTSEISKEKSEEPFTTFKTDEPKKEIDSSIPVSEKHSVQAEEFSSKSQTSFQETKDNIKKEESHPNSLYDTCCVKLAFLLRDKALEIASERTKLPPPKPPKPSAEAIAKARAAAHAKKIEAQKMNKSFGENFPIGYDGMRFADDETESSCDYKDVENFDYIMDYELINRYKIDSSKLDTFSVPSTCSGLTSYYTADSIMETISLSSDISYNFKQASFPSKNEMKISAADEKIIKKVDSISSSKGENSKQSIIKKVPPPIPPKPIILQNISKVKEKSDDKVISQCVNGLSLSPRLQNKFSKDPAVTQKRPLLVADIKGTQFSSLQHPKKPKKPTRNFETVLKNESLKKLPGVSSDNVPVPTENVFEKDSSLKDDAKIEKRTKSPPRPPPPNLMKKPEKPPKPDRPPPPIKILKGSISGEIAIKNEEESKDIEETSKLNEIEKSNELNKLDLNILSDLQNAALCDNDKSFEISSSENVINNEKSQMVEDGCDSNQSDFKTLQDNLNNNYETIKDISNNLSNNTVEISNATLIDKPKPPPRNRRIRSRTVEIFPAEKHEENLKRSSSLSEIDVEKRVTFLEAEKAKIDSKSLYTTVNKNEKKSNYEKTSRSSPDLVSGRPLPPPPPPPRRFRSLERKEKPKKSIKENLIVSVSRQVTSPDSSKDLKPPARRRKTEKERFLSLHTDRRKEISIASENLKRAESVPSKPERRIKNSLLTKYDVNANIPNLYSQEDQNSSNQSIPNADITDSVISRNPKLKREVESQKQSHSNWYDEDESLGDSWEFVNSLPSHESTEEYKESPKVPLRRKPGTRRKSRETSKFYIDMEEASTSPFEERTPSLTPIDQERKSPLPCVSKTVSPLPLVDKETSPLPLDCSEKSVQTSLETLSQGIVSHDDQSEDTDELLDLAQTLQKELSSIINRHKSVTDNIEDTPSPPLSAATSERNLAGDFKDMKKTSSVRSSTSEVWPITSSDESDGERVGEDSSNISEISVKRKQKKIFYIAQEIMTSEEAFVDALKVLNVDFKAAVEAANKQRNITVIPDETLSQILNHLPQLQHLNENLLMELKDRIENWDKHEKIADIIVKMGPFLKLYSWYIHDFESNVSLFEECKKKYAAFAQVVKEFEMSARCKKLALNHFMLKPIQRIPQYRLLLQEYLHQLTEDSKDYQDTIAALQIVSDVANHANDSMKQGDNAQKLISIQNSIVGHKEIVKPGRVFIKEGELMKLSRKGMQPRWFVLFNDLLLYLTPVQQGLYRVNHELPLTGMKVAIPIQQDYQNEFSIISVTRSFTLAARSQEERQEWIIALTKAIEENASKRSTFTNSRLHQKAQDKTSSEDESAFVLGRKAPVWIPDARVTMCQLCTSEFTVTFRRHHCRACGKVICSICSSHRISLPYLGNRIARVCDECHARLGQGSSACTESGETDSDNQQIAVKPHLRTDNRHIKKNKRSLPSVLKEVCANDQGSTISGYLHKKTGKSWKRDWFVVKDKVLYEYKASEDIAALRSIPLLGYEIESFKEALEGIDASLLFQLSHSGQAPIVFYSDTVGSTERWVSALKTATVLE